MHPTNNPSSNPKELTDFTDRVLQGKVDRTASNSDEELFKLEETILRLADTFPPEPLEDAKAKQMLVRLKARMRREEEEQAARPSLWKRLFDFQSNPQVALLITVAAVVMLAIIVLPSVEQPVGSSVSGTAFSGTSLFTVVGLAGVLVLLYWVSRRK